MNDTYILSLEELGLAFALCGYDEMAVGLLKEEWGALDEERWELIFRTASHSLLSKGLLNQLDEDNPRESLLPEFKKMIELMQNGKQLIRFYHGLTNGERVLTIHGTPMSLISHLSLDNLVHVVNATDLMDVQTAVNDFYQPQFMTTDVRIDSLSEEKLNLISELIKLKTTREDICERIQIPGIEPFIDDLIRNNGMFSNISTIKLDDDQYPAVVNVSLILPGQERIWGIQNTNVDLTQEPTLLLESLDETSWNKLIISYISRL